MAVLTVPSIAADVVTNPAAIPPNGSEAARARDAAQQFEALLLAQILRGVRESGAGLEKTDQTGDCATDFADQQFARVLAQQGGLGLASLIAAGLERRSGAAEAGAASG